MKRATWLFNAMILSILMSVSTSCSKKDSSTTTAITVPVLTTVTITSITESTAMSGGNISSNGGSAVLTSGVCWGLAANPTISDSKTTDGTLTGAFASAITGLTSKTTYYVRAYATNSAGTAYGAQQSFTTKEVVVPVFVMTYTVVTLTSGDKGVEFFADCSNSDVDITKVNITDPNHSNLWTYFLNDDTFVLGQLFSLQASGNAYTKESGTWQFEIIGKIPGSVKGFDITTTLSVTK
jgi:hypothetical protein